MKRTLLLLASLILVSGGCAGHVQKVKDGMVHFYVTRPGARDVYFASSLDGFQRHRAIKVGQETWEAKAPADREFKYFFVVDDVIFLSGCPLREQDDYGSENCIFLPGM
jgi:hypothetical protein